MRLLVTTLYDCRRTGVTGHYKLGSSPFVDKAGQTVNSKESWDRSRNQQRNLETLTQLLGMRTQITLVTEPTQDNDRWHFTVEPERPDVFLSDRLASVIGDCEGVPMITNLGESDVTGSVLKSAGPEQNIWFEIL